MKNNNTKKGFTLIELLVVIAIISLLSSVVIVGVSSAKLKAKDARVKHEMAQLVNFADLNFSEYGSYCQVNPFAWISNGGTCATVFPVDASHIYSASMQSICNDLIKNSADDTVGYSGYSPGELRLFSGVDVPYSCATSYSFMAYLNKGKWYCVGSGPSGVHIGEYANFPGNLGCYNNP